jgi:propionyl-CoA carboxylase alpha chain
LVVIEAMKMEHRITAADAGVIVSVAVRTGQVVSAGEVVVVVHTEEGS